MRRAAAWLALALAAALGFLSVWVVVPAPTLLLLPLGVAVPELSPMLAGAALLLAALSWIGRARRPLRVACAMSLLAALLLAAPLAQLPFALRRFDAAMAAAGLGGSSKRVPPSRRAAFSFAEFVSGVDRGTSNVRRGVAIGGAAGSPLVADLYSREGVRDAPVLVQIYGGAWQRGRPGDDEAFARYFAARGYLVAAIDYRHAPAARWPAQIEDVRTALAWLQSHASEHGGDASRLALLGRSAGAQLALLAAYEPGAPRVAGVVSFYGPVDLAEGWREPPRPDPLDVRTVLETYLGGTPAQMPGRYQAASPVAHVTPSSPPTLLVYGTRDHIVSVRFAHQLESRLRSVRVPVALLELPWAEHAFDALPDGLSAQVSLFYVERFLARLFTSPPRRPATESPAPPSKRP